MTDVAKVLGRPDTRRLYEAEARHRQTRGTLGPFARRGGLGHARRLLRGQTRRTIGRDSGHTAVGRREWAR